MAGRANQPEKASPRHSEAFYDRILNETSIHSKLWSTTEGVAALSGNE